MERDADDVLMREAIIYSLPLYEMARMRAATCPRRDMRGDYAGNDPDSTLRWVNHFVHMRQLLGPQHRQVVTPNNDTLYSNAWLDLSAGPLVLRVPASAERYYVMGLLDFYTNPFGYIGTRTTGNGAGVYFLHGPQWQGQVPAGATTIRCPTNAVWMIGRIMADGANDLAQAHTFQDGFAIELPNGSAAHRKFDVGMQPNEFIGRPDRYAEVVRRALIENPPPREEASLLADFSRIGLGPQPQAARLDEESSRRMGHAIGAVLEEIGAPQPSALGGGWFLPVEVHESFGNDYFTRAQIARNYIGALGVEEAMYLMADCDGSGLPLDGGHQYELHFPAGGLPQVDAFWSITMYDKADCMLVDNPLGRYSLGDRLTSLRYEPDGGLRLFFSAQAPSDEAFQGNWLPAPSGSFYLTLRLYMPRKPHLDKTFAYPPIVRLDSMETP